MLKHLHQLTVIALCLASLLLIAGCSSSPTIDGSSDETMQASIQEVAKTLNEKQAKDFAQAVMVVGMKEAMTGADPAGIRKKLDGKTADEVIEMANEIAKQ